MRVRLGLRDYRYTRVLAHTTSAWAGWSRFDIPVDRYGGVQYIPCYVAPAEHWVSYLPLS